MIVRLQIDDEIFDRYERMAERTNMGGKAAGAADLISAHLDRFSEVNPTDRVLVINSQVRGKIETLVGGASIKDADDLYNRIERLASLRIGDIRMDLTPGQMAQLKAYAVRNRRNLDEVFKDVVKSMTLHLFEWVS